MNYVNYRKNNINKVVDNIYELYIEIENILNNNHTSIETTLFYEYWDSNEEKEITYRMIDSFDNLPDNSNGKVLAITYKDRMIFAYLNKYKKCLYINYRNHVFCIDSSINKQISALTSCLFEKDPVNFYYPESKSDLIYPDINEEEYHDFKF